jgi:mycothiol synthase
MGIWEKGGETAAWAVFQPPWWNLDYAIHPSERGSCLEQEVLAWGKEQIMGYARRTGEDFDGSVEIFKDTPNVERTIEHLASLGFEKFDWSIIRFEQDLNQELPLPQLPDGFSIRPLRGKTEVEAYVRLHRAAFGSDHMTTAWRMRMLEHPAYRPDIDLVAVDAKDRLVGFCGCWIWQGVGQIEPMGVHPDYQAKGLGRALELAALQALRNAGARYMHVDHVSVNEAAIALSQKTGFRQINNAVRYFVKTNAGDH